TPTYFEIVGPFISVRRKSRVWECGDGSALIETLPWLGNHHPHADACGSCFKRRRTFRCVPEGRPDTAHPARSTTEIVFPMVARPVSHLQDPQFPPILELDPLKRGREPRLNPSGDGEKRHAECDKTQRLEFHRTGEQLSQVHD